MLVFVTVFIWSDFERLLVSTDQVMFLGLTDGVNIRAKALARVNCFSGL